MMMMMAKKKDDDDDDDDGQYNEDCKKIKIKKDRKRKT